ncbi:hypothetical protein F909_04116 [Acinetobacter sp. ANC 3929]|uniref:phage tail protein n=1 Tax=unclassified Acinetobacter TaxID=196816 RepID=UPI0002D07619|nr:MULTISPECIES: phage tail protein [unclassified Acinetobacter]ENW78426.1 hypothetical protein F909_04116 [Acinetobacter sp. ANC 3929]MCH7353251.1 phage tail protein [Acinetobacter sp. NIPH 2023]MCH7357259.1 phage tail protein [Acinetobacter sp. NIPH 1958]MCH7360633.1 phage tail protein [Acinetobacter sp. NIPH 2024]
MGGSSSQVVGYKYKAGVQSVLGNPIEYIININPDNRGWIFNNPTEIKELEKGDNSIVVNRPDLFGGDKGEGGWVGTIDIHTGRPEGLRQNPYLAEQDSELVSSFPFLSHIVYRGFDYSTGFQLVSMSGMMKEVLYWVKRIHIKNDCSPQWYDAKAEIIDSSYIDGADEISIFESTIAIQCDGHEISHYEGHDDWKPEDGHIKQSNEAKLDDAGGWYGEGRWNDSDFPPMIAIVDIDFDVYALHKAKITFLTSDYPLAPSYVPQFSLSGAFIISVFYEATGGAINRHTYDIVFVGKNLNAIIKVDPHINHEASEELKSYTNTIGLIETITYYPKPFINEVNIGTDINPIHKIREIITDDTAMNKPESMINEVNFKAAASRIYDEYLGISWAITEKTCKDAIDELCFHIEAGVRLNRQTGQYEVILFRDDLLDLDNAFVFNKSNIKSFNIEIANSDDLINSVNVNYYDRQNIKNSSFSLDEIGSIMSSEANAQTLDFPYFMNRQNAEKVGNWKLKQLSTPTRKGTFTTGKYEARKINKYDVVKLTWPNQNMLEIPVRIMKIGLGDGRDNTVTLDWVEVIPYSSTAFPKINVDPPTSIVLPPQPNLSVVFEMPYLEAVQIFGQTQVDAELANNPDLGYLMVASKKPQNNSINALLYTKVATSYQQASIVNYCPTCYLDQSINFLTTSFAVKNVAAIGDAAVGTLIVCDQELMVYQGYNPTTKVLTVKRGALDTHPKPHFEDAVFYFYDAFNAYDSEQYVLSELIKAKVLTTTPSGIQDLASAPELPLEINARPIRPYPPANIKINDVYFIENLVISNDVVVTWVDRNRLQQTGGSILGWTDGSVTKETGVTYSIELSSEGTVLHSASGITANTYTINHSVLKPNKVHKLRLWSIRDGYDCYQVFEHSFFGEAVSLTLSATVSKDKVVGSTLPAASVTAVVDESLGANMRWDGTSIKGKAVPGSTITIEVQE